MTWKLADSELGNHPFFRGELLVLGSEGWQLGVGERVVDFTGRYQSSWLLVVILLGFLGTEGR